MKFGPNMGERLTEWGYLKTHDAVHPLSLVNRLALKLQTKFVCSVRASVTTVSAEASLLLTSDFAGRSPLRRTQSGFERRGREGGSVG